MYITNTLYYCVSINSLAGEVSFFLVIWGAFFLGEPPILHELDIHADPTKKYAMHSKTKVFGAPLWL